jgi:hypothetical protein
MNATEQQIRELAQTIANQAQGLADGSIPTGRKAAHAALIANNLETLQAWIGDDRPHTTKTSAIAPKRTVGGAR